MNTSIVARDIPRGTPQMASFRNRVCSPTLASITMGQIIMLSSLDWSIQVPGCLTAKTPDDCPEKLEGHACSPDRPGIFEVIGKPLVLHVGQDVRNAMSCMVHADGVLMGCSTFGQLAGLLSKGISMFSMHCSGNKSPIQYRTIPPIAVAERGYMWVPVEGSWQDPVLKSTDILSGALDTLLENRKG